MSLTVVTQNASNSRARMLTFRGGGWVILLTLLVCGALITWALAPAILRMADPPAGDGMDITTYGFDLGNLTVPERLIAPAMKFRDMVQPMDEPLVFTVGEVEGGAAGRKLVVSSDRVIGVTINGESRAYPVMVMNVHEIVHDTLGGVPIAVTYHWPCDSVRVYDRRVGGSTRSFGVSGLVYNSHLLMYERRDDDGPERLWSHMLGTPISGPASTDRLTPIGSELVSWSRWINDHPESTIVGRNPGLRAQRYKKGEPTPYFQKHKILFPVEPTIPESGPAAFDRIIGVSVNGTSRCYSAPAILEAAQDGRWQDTLDGQVIHFLCDDAAETIAVRDANAQSLPVQASLWFAWHATYPDQPVWTGPAVR